jgi:hypothetical protein
MTKFNVRNNSREISKGKLFTGKDLLYHWVCKERIPVLRKSKGSKNEFLKSSFFDWAQNERFFYFLMLLHRINIRSFLPRFNRGSTQDRP